MSKRRPYNRYLDKGLRGWIVQQAKRNIWRMPDWYDIDDLISEGFLAFAITKERYGHRVENRSHFMSLFKRVYLSRIVNLANARSKQAEWGLADIAISQIAVPGREHSALEAIAPLEPPDAEFQCCLAKAPKEVAAFLNAIQTGKMDAPRLPARNGNGQFDKKGTRRETNFAFFNRVMQTIGYDYEKELKELLA